MCNLINTYIHTYILPYIYTYTLYDQITSDRVADPESIAPVGGDAEIALVRHSQFRNVVCPQEIVCVPLCIFSRLGWASGEFRSSYLCTVHDVYDCASPVAAGVQPAQKMYDILRLGRRHTDGAAGGSCCEELLLQEGRGSLPSYRGYHIFLGCGELCVPGSQSRLVYRQVSPFGADRIACTWRGAPLVGVKHVIVFSVAFWA